MIQDFLRPLISNWAPWLQVGAVATVIASLVFLRYSAFTAVAYGVSRLIKRFAPARRLQPQDFTGAQIRREVFDSMLSIFTFTAVVGLIILMTQAGWTQIYMDPCAYGWIWFWLQIPIALLIQDWYFYWMHRTIHRPEFYDRIHKRHHLSTNPSPFAAFAFHPLEAILEIAIFVLIVMVLPMTPLALLSVSLFSLAYNVYGHLGYEIMPRVLAKSWIGPYLNKSAYHNQHHRTYRYNYGLYTTIWDRMHGTLHPKADPLYDKVSQGQPVDQVIGTQPSSCPPQALR